jgi:hypothetical protein
MRYIEKSRVAKDMQTLDTVYEAVQAALTDEDAYEEFANATAGTYNDTLEALADVGTEKLLGNELKASLGSDLGKVDLVSRSAGSGKVYVKIDFAANGGLNISVYCGNTDKKIAVPTGDNTDYLDIVGYQDSTITKAEKTK